MSEFARYLLSASPAVIYTCKADDSYATTYISENVVDLLGYDPHDFLDDPRFWTDRVHPEDLPAALNAAVAVFKDGHHAREYRFKTKSGNYRWLRDELRLAYNEATKTSGLVGSWLDITERKTLEESYRRFAGFSSDYIHVCTRTGKEPFRIQWLDGAVTAITGYSIEEVLAMGCWLSVVHPEDRQAMTLYLFSLALGDRRKIEFRIVTKTGEIRWLSENSLCEAGPSAGELLLSGAVTDITKRKQAEEKLRISEERLRKITDAAHDAILMMDPQGNISYWNPAAEKILGYRSAEALGKNLHNLLAPERYLEEHLAAFPAFQRTGRGKAIGKTLELSARRKDGEEIDVALSLSSILLNGEWHAMGILRNVTAQKRAEEELKHSHELMKYIIEHARSAVAVHDRELRYMYVSQRYLDEYNVTGHNIIGRHHYEVFPDLPQKWRDVHQRALAGEVSSAEEDPYVREDGSVDWTRWECRPWYEADGSIGGIIVYTEVITERKRAEERLREADHLTIEALRQAEFERDKTKAILETMADGISIQDPELRVIYQNTAQRSRMGDHLGEFCYQAYQQRDDICPDCHLMQSFADGQVHMRETTASPGGELRHFQIVSTPVFDPSGKLIAGIEAVRDITARKQVEEHLQQKTGELESANRELEAFSYTLAHDLRSYLARITLAGESLQEFEGERLDDNGRYLLQTIVGTCQGMDELIATMLTLAHISRQELKLQDINLSILAEHICGELTKAEPGRALHFDIAPGIHLVGDAHLIRVALENLLGNACKYTRGKPEARISLNANRKDDRLVVAIADNGTGFDMVEAEKLFRPFQRLSSSRSFPGFGIGLTTVERIIKRHGGEIWAEAAPDEGATFYFSLPGEHS
ncbi:MAG: PAS domain S-box protein [Desulfuromonas sp.]|nr:PAS domain S-box protein [Desulfuromonas sp.]